MSQFNQGPHAVTCKCNLLSLEKPRMRGVFLKNVVFYSKLIQEAHIKEVGSLCFHPLHEGIETRIYCFLEEYLAFQTMGFSVLFTDIVPKAQTQKTH